MAVQQRLALPVLVWNHESLQEIADQMDQRNIERTGVQPGSPDFVMLAESRGRLAVRVTDADHLAQTVRGALQADRPTLIEVRQHSAWLVD